MLYEQCVLTAMVYAALCWMFNQPIDGGLTKLMDNMMKGRLIEELKRMDNWVYTRVFSEHTTNASERMFPTVDEPINYFPEETEANVQEAHSTEEDQLVCEILDDVVESSKIVDAVSKGNDCVNVDELNLDNVFEPSDLSLKTIRQLKAIAREKKLTGYSNMRKAELIYHLSGL